VVAKEALEVKIMLSSVELWMVPLRLGGYLLSLKSTPMVQTKIILTVSLSGKMLIIMSLFGILGHTLMITTSYQLDLTQQ
jgi:hypothetical protein